MNKKQPASIFTDVTRQQNYEFGLVSILVLAILSYWLDNRELLLSVIILSLIVIIAPVLFTPFTAIWYKLSYGINKVMSSILLGLIFLLVIIPVGYIRRLCKKDSLLLRPSNKNRKSVFIPRDHVYSKEDLRHMF